MDVRLFNELYTSIGESIATIVFVMFVHSSYDNMESFISISEFVLRFNYRHNICTRFLHYRVEIFIQAFVLLYFQLNNSAACNICIKINFILLMNR